MSKPLLLDLFCGAGGASVGYHRAGFDVIGVDIKRQPRYPFDFVQADALVILGELVAGTRFETDFLASDFAAIHASPPCQDHSPLKVNGLHGTGWMLDHTRKLLASQPALWIIENVGSADMRADFMLCGNSFGLQTVRHRRFELDPRFPGLLSVPAHTPHIAPTSTKKRRRDLDAGMNISITGDVGSYLGPACMGIDWMTGNELSQAIPPAYTEYIGLRLMEYLNHDQNVSGQELQAAALRTGTVPEALPVLAEVRQASSGGGSQ